MKYRKKPVIVDAVQFDGTEESAVEITLQDNFEGVLDYTSKSFGGLFIGIYDKRVRVDPMDWVIKDDIDEFYTCKPDIFEKLYEKVN